jgi:ElaA protein
MIVRKFDDLSAGELYDIMRLRQEVFVVEQDCAYLDADGHDKNGVHLLHYEDERLVAYARILPMGISYSEYASIGRIAVAKENRGKGLGATITTKAVEISNELFGGAPIKISAQCYILDMYSKLGFDAVGESYLEDGIPHQAMIWRGEV